MKGTINKDGSVTGEEVLDYIAMWVAYKHATKLKGLSLRGWWNNNKKK